MGILNLCGNCEVLSYPTSLFETNMITTTPLNFENLAHTKTCFTVCIYCVYVDSIIHQHAETTRLSGSEKTIKVVSLTAIVKRGQFNAGNNFFELVLLAAELLPSPS